MGNPCLEYVEFFPSNKLCWILLCDYFFYVVPFDSANCNIRFSFLPLACWIGEVVGLSDPRSLFSSLYRLIVAIFEGKTAGQRATFVSAFWESAFCASLFSVGVIIMSPRTKQRVRQGGRVSKRVIAAQRATLRKFEQPREKMRFWSRQMMSLRRKELWECGLK